MERYLKQGILVSFFKKKLFGIISEKRSIDHFFYLDLLN